ncbi:MAG TPA: glycosyl transferase family 90 [Rhodopila sp.]|uniref:glycosyl transferase family 90 n=1 Tax=Rhodopila sp. TaxID=2480087 RepID=UPI002CA2F2BC|nr:glycosyl transferase family 90 [Rhodopila sp.]HVY14406.1 glycosyl transferase family 90 [Rhodopila sp.]
MSRDPTVHGLLLQQMAPWLGSPIEPKLCEEVYQALNRTVRSVFVYRIGNGQVTLLEKPGFRVREEFHDSRQNAPEGNVIFREEYIRAHLYREFLERVLGCADSFGDLLVAIDVNDAPVETADAPVLTFQKKTGSNTVLLPDVDFLHSNFYLPRDYHDDIPYAQKLPKAIFAGSTTGGRAITARDVQTLAIPRLRAGMFFKDNPHVDFRIPRIIQCESDAVVEMIAALGINAEPTSWQDQFRYRFILSMDGNGATCSRVAIGLSSQAVLAKYASPFQLFYFSALIPWRHYIPISEDQDVERTVLEELRRPMAFAYIAEEGREFARRHLGRAGVYDYALQLLLFLQSCTSKTRAHHGLPGGRSESATPLIEVGAHVQNIGDVWAWADQWVGQAGSGRAIEAIAIVPVGIPDDALIYRVTLRDGTISDFAEFGAFCGTRGREWPLRGFEVRLRDNVKETLSCTYVARFVDGTSVGPLEAGEMCCAASGASLEALQISVRKLPTAKCDPGPAQNEVVDEDS